MPALVPPPKQPPVVAAFDFDGTLTRRDTLMPFLARGLGWPRFARVLLQCAPWLAGYACRLIRNDVAKARLLRLALGGRSLAEIEAWTQRWLAHDFPGQLQPWTMAQLAWHQAAGHCCLLVSASPDIYLRHVATQLGFDGLVCTEMQVQDARLTGQMQTPNCHGEQKVIRLRAWLAARYGPQSVDTVVLYAYGDTAGDKPMLRLARHAWYRGQPWKGAPPAG